METNKITESRPNQTTESRPIDLRATNSYESATLGKLFEALAKAQMNMQVAKTDSVNPYFKSKYASLASVIKASRPCLSINGLCVVQRVLPDDKGINNLLTRYCKHCNYK